MGSKAFNKIMAGLVDALAHAKGDTSRAQVHKVQVKDVDVAKVRESMNLTQEEFATVFHVKSGTVRNWEQRVRKPQGPALVLLNVIANHPEAVLSSVRAGPGKFILSSKEKARKSRGRPKKKATGTSASRTKKALAGSR